MHLILILTVLVSGFTHAKNSDALDTKPLHNNHAALIQLQSQLDQALLENSEILTQLQNVTKNLERSNFSLSKEMENLRLDLFRQQSSINNNLDVIEKSEVSVKQVTAKLENLDKELARTEQWMNTIISVFLGLTALLLTAFGIAVPMIAYKRYEAKLANKLRETENSFKKNSEFIKLQMRASNTSNLNEKVQIYDEMQNLVGDDFNIFLNRAEIKVNLGCKQEAIKDLCTGGELIQQALSAKKISSREASSALWIQGKTFSRTLEHSRAVASFNESIKLNEFNTQAYCSRGNILCNLMKNKEAMNDYNFVIKNSDKRSFEYCNAYANILLDNKNHAKAIDYFRQALKIDQSSLACILGKAAAHHYSEQYEAAEADFHTALEISPSNTITHLNFAYCLATQKKWQEAIEEFSEVISLNSESCQPYIEKIKCKIYLLITKDGTTINVEDAIADINKAIEINHQTATAIAIATAYFLLALLYSIKNEPSESIRNYDFAIKYSKDNQAIEIFKQYKCKETEKYNKTLGNL